MAPIIKRNTTPVTFDKFDLARNNLNAYLDMDVTYSPGNIVKTNREFLAVFLYGVHAHTDIDQYLKFKQMSAADALITPKYRGTGTAMNGLFLYHLQEILIRLKNIQLSITGL